jgi:hypothetical protein
VTEIQCSISGFGLTEIANCDKKKSDAII